MRHPRYRCASCEEEYGKASIARSGERKDGTRWHVCRDCQRAFVRSEQFVDEAYEAARRSA